MSNPTKPGGGNKPQPYIAAGNGEESGQYTDKENATAKKTRKLSFKSSCHIRNRPRLYNPLKSKLVKKVRQIYIAFFGNKIPTRSTPNSVVKKIVNGEIEEERYYDSKGETYLEIHYTDHGNPKNHPMVPHIHKSHFIDGVYYHAKGDKFQ